jgi:hypothetical protein
MDRRSFLSLLPVALCPLPALAAPRRETLNSLLLRQQNWDKYKMILKYVYSSSREHEGLLYCNKETVEAGFPGAWFRNSDHVFWVKTKEGPMKIDPSTLELLPFTPPVSVGH